MLYIILVSSPKEGTFDEVVYQGRDPFITDKKERAEVYKEHLEEEWIDSTYTVCEVRKL